MYGYNASIYNSLKQLTQINIDGLKEFLTLNENHRDYGHFHPFEDVYLNSDGLEFKMLSYKVIIRVKYFTATKTSTLRTYLKENNLTDGEVEYTHIPSMDIVVSLEDHHAFFLQAKQLWNERNEQQFIVKRLRRFGHDYVAALALALQNQEETEWKKDFAESFGKVTTS